MTTDSPNGRSSWPGRFWLAGAVFVLTLVWLVALPAISDLGYVARRLRILERNDVDAAALFYTDLRAMDDIQSRVSSIRDEHPEDFWSFRTGGEFLFHVPSGRAVPSDHVD